MSVLVEALALVVRRLTLDLSWPGGADAFLQSLCRDDSPCRHLCTDGTLVSVSFLTPGQAAVVGGQLIDRGLVEVGHDQFVDFAFVDQRHGPTMPCPWLAWRRHRDGFTYAWPADAEPGDLAVPSDWTPERSRRLTRTDARDEPDRMLRLAHDEATGLETWLDFATGAITRGCARVASAPLTPPTPPIMPDSPSPDAPAPLPLLAQVDAAIHAAGYVVSESTDDTRVLRFAGVNTDYTLRLWGDDAAGWLVCCCLLPTRVPADRRGAAAEAVARINYEVPVGAFDFDVRDGELRFRYGAALQGATLGAHVVVNMIGIALQTCEQFHDALLGVAFGGADPAAAVALALAPTAPPGASDADAAAPDAPDIDQIIAELTADLNPEPAAPRAADARERRPERARRGDAGGVGPAAPPAPAGPTPGAGVDTRAPFPNSYVVPDTRLIAGEYPGCAPGRRRRAEAKLGAVLDAGVRTLVDLTRPEDGLAPYADALAAAAAERGLGDVVHHALPIRDMGTCGAAEMRAILDTIDAALADGRGVYVHCWGGVGRTGTVIGCWLVRHGRGGAAALDEVGRMFATMSPSKRTRHPEGSPQTREQRAMVLGWHAHDRA